MLIINNEKSNVSPSIPSDLTSTADEKSAVFWMGKCLGPQGLRLRQALCTAGPGQAPQGQAGFPSDPWPVGAEFPPHLLPQVGLWWGIEQPSNAHGRCPHQPSNLQRKLKLRPRISWRQTLCACERCPRATRGLFCLYRFAASVFRAPRPRVKTLVRPLYPLRPLRGAWQEGGQSSGSAEAGQGGLRQWERPLCPEHRISRPPGG